MLWLMMNIFLALKLHETQTKHKLKHYDFNLITKPTMNIMMLNSYKNGFIFKQFIIRGNLMTF